jgi:pyruvate/2-oxoacid:ferredoxin oxidoreductase alpha subunit
MMGKKMLLRGNEVIAEAAIRAGCQCYFAYPIGDSRGLPVLLRLSDHSSSGAVGAHGEEYAPARANVRPG